MKSFRDYCLGEDLPGINGDLESTALSLRAFNVIV